MEKIVKKALLGTILSIAVIIILMTLFDVKISDVLAVGLTPFIISTFLIILTLIVRGLRFYSLVKNYQNDLKVGFGESILVRTASEFIALISPSFIGDEAFRLGWLTKRGVNAGKALWIAYMEIFCDVIVGTTLSLVSSIYFVFEGAYIFGAIIGVIALFVLLIHVFFIIYMRKNRISIPKVITNLMVKLFKKKGERLIESMLNALKEFSELTKGILKETSLKLITFNVFLTILMAVLMGTSLNVLLDAVGVKIGLFTSILIVYAAIALATLPITIGGSGLTEIGVAFSVLSIAGSSPWNAVLVWRIASYHIPLILTGLTLIVVLFKLKH